VKEHSINSSSERDAFYSWSHKLTRVPSDPKIVYVTPTNACNYRCGICARTKTMKKVGFMDIELFKKIIDELPVGVKQLYLFKQGESTLHPKISEMMRYIKDKRPDIQLKLNTNGSRLTTSLMKNMVRCIDILTVSMWSVRPETYYKLHGRDNLTKVVNNLKELISLREKEGSKMTIWIDYVKQKGNNAESEEEVIDFFKHNGCKGITIVFYWAYNFLGFGKEGHLEINGALPYREFPLCIYPWDSFTVTWDGEVSYCMVEPREETLLGDMKTQSFESIWNNKKYIQFRKLLVEKRFDELEKHKIFCKYCPFIWSSHAQKIDKDGPLITLENKELLEEYLNREGRSLDDFNPHYAQI